MYGGSGEVSGWAELLSAAVGPPGAEQVSGVRFSPEHEILWAGTESGNVYSLQFPSLERYASVRAHNGGVVDMAVLGDGLASISADMLRYHAVGGLPQATVSAPEGAEMLACSRESQKNSRVAVLCSDDSIASYDVVAARMVEQATLEGGGVIVRGPGVRGLLAVGTTSGDLLLVDPASGYKVEARLPAHAGGVLALDMRGDMVVTAGLGLRHGQPVVERAVRVFDLRGAPRVFASVPFAAGPAMVAWHPKFTATVLIGSSSGLFTLADTTSNGYTPTHQVLTEGDALVDCTISSTGEAIAFGGSGGYVHLWSSAQQLVAVNRFSEPLEVPSRRPAPSVSLSEHDSFGAVPELFCQEGKPLSAFDGAQLISAGLPPRMLDPSVLKGLKQVDFVGYATNPHSQRGLARGEAAKRVAAIRNLRRSRKAAAEAASNGAAVPKRVTAEAAGALPARYCRLLIDQQTGVNGVWDYDYSVHNPTPFAGLENGIANCYTNSLWQVLHFIPELRAAVLAHAVEVDKEFCLACELGFLFRMLHDAKGSVCQASNLIRALRQSREAAALGLLEGQSQRSEGQQDIEVNVNKERAVDRRLQNLQRFLLEQLHRELSGSQESERPASDDASTASTSSVDRIFGMKTVQRTQCLTGAPDERLRHSRTFQVELQYPPASERPAQSSGNDASGEVERSRTTFADILASSLRPVAEMRAWFNEDRGYQVLRQTRVPVTLPKVLVVSCNLRDKADIAWWTAYSEGSGERPWLPNALRISINPDQWQVAATEASSTEELAASSANAGAQNAVYELCAVIWQVRDDDATSPKTAAEPQDEHVVAHIKVPAAYLSTSRDPQAGGKSAAAASGPTESVATDSDLHEQAMQDAARPEVASADGPQSAPAANGQQEQNNGRGAAQMLTNGSPAEEWLLFNDFAISPAEADDVRRLYGAQKVPVVLYYRQVAPASAEPVQQPAAPRPVLSGDQFRQLCLEGSSPATGSRVQQPTFVPLADDEAPKAGTLLGLDAEFVALSQPDRRIIGDEYVEVRRARLGLARVSVVRGEGPALGAACIDDYVRTLEPVTDYLTKWSGLTAEDLDPALSRHHLTTLKRAYLKLRYLVDAGCVFVGHDLEKDFRMINIVVPPEQVVDTVALYRLPHQRKLRLRFLASYVLREDIQQTTHDSIEDARAAVLLLHEARRLQAAGTFKQKLQEIYSFGKVHVGWGGVYWHNGLPQPLEA